MILRNMKKRFAALSLSKGFINASQVIEALTIQIKENIEQEKHRPIGEIFYELGYMNKEQINEVLESTVEPRFGDVAISKGFISVDQLVEAMTVQLTEEAEQDKHRLIGEILVDLGHMSRIQVQETLNTMQNRG